MCPYLCRGRIQIGPCLDERSEDAEIKVARVGVGAHQRDQRRHRRGVVKAREPAREEHAAAPLVWVCLGREQCTDRRGSVHPENCVNQAHNALCFARCSHPLRHRVRRGGRVLRFVGCGRPKCGAKTHQRGLPPDSFALR